MPVPPSRPFIVIYVLWHPGFEGGKALAEALYGHFRRNLFVNVTGGAGISVVYRSAAQHGSSAPPAIDFEDAETTAVVTLVDRNLCADSHWKNYLDQTAAAAERLQLRALMLPVAIEKEATSIGSSIKELNFLRWYQSAELEIEQRTKKLIADISYELCRMLRHYLEQLRHPAESAGALAQYLKKVRIFLSHSKHDTFGKRIATEVRQHIISETGLATFFDATDIPPGLRFSDVLMHYVRVSAVIAIHTDSYSSREWCRREILEAKRSHVPLVVVNCINDFEERSFPYIGNVPAIRMEPGDGARIGAIIALLIDEVLKDFLWMCRVEVAKKYTDEFTIFVSRPPELIALTSIPPGGCNGKQPMKLIYPDPPLGAEEIQVFKDVAPALALQSYSQWLGS